MQKIRNTILGVTLFMVCYQFLPFAGVSDRLILGLFLISPFIMIWMVYKVLKQGKATDKTWEDYFYEDFDYRRNGKEEIST